MRKICSLSAILVFASAMAFAETWSGQLMDASCADQHKTDQKYEACAPTMETAAFAIQVDGKMRKLDTEGNKKAAEAWKEYNSSADRSKDPNTAANAVATVQGILNGDEIKVESIKFQ